VEKESDHHEHPRNHARLAADVAERPAGPALDHRRAGGADLVLESAGGDTFSASLAAARRVTGRVVVYGLAGGDASITNWDLVYQHQIHVIGLNIGMLIQAAPQIFGEVMGELFVLMAAGALTPSQPTAYELADGPKALTELEARATVGKLALLP
jgi:NADPH:quinone reductase